MNKRPRFIILMFICSIIAMVGVVALTAYLNQTITSTHDETIVQPYKAQIAEKDRIIAGYKEGYEQILQVKNEYRGALKDMVELLYNKDTHVGIGGSYEAQIPESDEAFLLMIKNSALTMEDDYRMMMDVKQYLEARKQFSDNFPFVWPVNKGGAPAISSSYGFRENAELHPGEDGIHFHAGLDIPGNMGDEIIATAEGVISGVYWNNPVLGNYVVIDHKYGFQTIYGHLSAINVGGRGQRVKRGDIIGRMGNTGYSFGVHVHYEIRKDGISLDPLSFLNINF